MSMIRRIVPVEITQLNDDEVEVIMSTGQLARDGHILEPRGCQLDNYLRNPIILWNHDPEFPVGRAQDVKVDGDKIRALIKFAPLGASPKADEIRALVKSDIVRGVSVGFDPVEAEPLNPAKPRGGMRISEWDLLECSFCSVPVDAEALVTARAKLRRSKEDWKVGVSRDLAIEDGDEEWDGGEASHSIFEHAGGDDFDPEKARKGFLAYNAAAPNKRGSYKFPIAREVDGELKVAKSGLRAAASRLPDSDLPDDVKKEARAVLDHYEEKAGMKKENDNAEGRARKPKIVRGLCDVAQLAWLLEQLGWLHSSAEIEAEIEGDGSTVPEKLGAALKEVGDVLVAMTEEEVTELFGGETTDVTPEDVAELEEGDRAYIRAGKTPKTRQWRRGIVIMRTRHKLHSAHARDLERGIKHITRAQDRHEDLEGHHVAIGKHHEKAVEAHGKAVEKHEETGAALEAAQQAHKDGDHEGAQEHVATALKHHRATAKQHEAVGQAHEELGDAHGDAQDEATAMGRSIDGAERCMRAMEERSTTGAEDDEDDTQQSQTSDGVTTSPEDEETEEDDNTERSYRRRQAISLELGFGEVESAH